MEHAIQHAEASRIGVHFHLAADGHDELLADVADHRAAVRRDLQRLDMVFENLVHGQPAEATFGIAVGAFAENETGNPVQRAHQLQGAEHAVDAIRRFAHVFQEQDLAVEFRQVRGARQRREHGQVAADQFALCLAAGHGDCAVLPLHQFTPGVRDILVLHQFAVEEHTAELVGIEGIPAARAVGPVEGDQAGLCVDGVVQGGDVGIAQQHLGVAADQVVVQQRQQACGTGTTAQADDGLDLLVAEHGVEVGGAFGIRTRQMATAGRQMLAGFHFEAKGLHDLLRDLQVQRLIGGLGGADQPHGVAGVQWQRQQALACACRSSRCTAEPGKRQQGSGQGTGFHEVAFVHWATLRGRIIYSGYRHKPR